MHCIWNYDLKEPLSVENLASYAKCDSDEDLCGSWRYIEIAETSLMSITTKELPHNTLCVYSIFTWPPTNATDFFTQTEFGFKFKVYEGSKDDFQVGIVSNKGNYSEFISGEV